MASSSNKFTVYVYVHAYAYSFYHVYRRGRVVSKIVCKIYWSNYCSTWFLCLLFNHSYWLSGKFICFVIRDVWWRWCFKRYNQIKFLTVSTMNKETFLASSFRLGFPVPFWLDATQHNRLLIRRKMLHHKWTNMVEVVAVMVGHRYLALIRSGSMFSHQANLFFVVGNLNKSQRLPITNTTTSSTLVLS